MPTYQKLLRKSFLLFWFSLWVLYLVNLTFECRGLRVLRNTNWISCKMFLFELNDFIDLSEFIGRKYEYLEGLKTYVYYCPSVLPAKGLYFWSILCTRLWYNRRLWWWLVLEIRLWQQVSCRLSIAMVPVRSNIAFFLQIKRTWFY